MMKVYNMRRAWLSLVLVFSVMFLSVSGIADESTSNDEVSMIVLTGEAASYWPRWRGPSGQGNVSDYGWGRFGRRGGRGGGMTGDFLDYMRSLPYMETNILRSGAGLSVSYKGEDK